MARWRNEAGFLLVEALVAVALLALSATVIVAVASDAIRASSRELDEAEAWSVMETLALELGRFGKMSPRAGADLLVGPYRIRLVRLDDVAQPGLATHELRAEATDTGARPLVISVEAPQL